MPSQHDAYAAVIFAFDLINKEFGGICQSTAEKWPGCVLLKIRVTLELLVAVLPSARP